MTLRNRQPIRTWSILPALGTIVLLCCLFAGNANAQVPPGCDPQLGTADLIDHNNGVSFCELCDEGLVRIEIENPIDAREGINLENLLITEDLRGSGLTFVNGSTRFSGANISVPENFDPFLSGPNNSVLSWDLSSTGLVLGGQPFGSGSRRRLFLEFNVERASTVDEEGLVGAPLGHQAFLSTEPSCATTPGATYSTSTGIDTLELREPEPVVTKLGRNLDAGQSGYSDPVYGHEGDDVIWQIQIENGGAAPLQDFRFSDSMVPGNFEINYLCDVEGDAVSAANGGGTGGCVNLGTTTDLLNRDVAATFGGGANPYIVAPAGGIRNYYLVGEVTSSCVNRDNTVFDVEWGCQSQSPAGGIDEPSGGGTVGDTAILSTQSIAANVDIDVEYTGINRSQPMGATGTVTLRITNTSGGTIAGEAAGLHITHLLPPDYVIDSTFTPVAVMTPAHGSTYNGMIDTVTWTNPAPNTVPLVVGDPADPLSNTNLDFRLTSTTTQTQPTAPSRSNMIRHGDVLEVRFRTVLINPTYYDYNANLDVREEEPGSDPANTDPAQSFGIQSESEFFWQEFCTPTIHSRNILENDTANPEDLDIDVEGSELIFILTSNPDPLPLRVNLRNRGGHDADDYFLYVTFGEAMTVQSAPSSCSVSPNPPPRSIWLDPDPLAPPPTATVYVCDPGTVRPGRLRALNFEVLRNVGAVFDDLTFRADVVGEITLSDGRELWFPTPTVRGDGVIDRANDYSIDSIWARVIGYNLFKTQEGLCSENVAAASNPDAEVEIGEECTYRIRSGDWFGFETPGFSYIAVQNVRVVDELPDGQAYISSTDPLLTSTTAIQGVSINTPPVTPPGAPPSPLDEGFFDWRFNQVTPAERITERNHWFQADTTARILNDPPNSVAPPNEHSAESSNILTSTFDAIFFNLVTGLEETYTLGPSTVGFPREFYRRVDLTVTEPELTVTKRVCNETRYGIGAACTNFVDVADDGDAFDQYVFEITVENEAASDGFTRAPAYDVTVTSTTDPSDELLVDILTGDGLDNDGDGATDPTDGSEGTISDNTVLNGTPAQIIASYTHSPALERIDPGDSVTLYYRVDPNDDVAPLQQLVGSAIATYDSLNGDSGNQTIEPGLNGEIAGARQYTTAADQATIQIIPVEVSPKQILRTSNTPLVLPANPQPITIGEEVEFQLEALLPVAQLRSFQIRDELPAGIRCIEAPTINLNAPPYDTAQFMPGGTFTPTCTDSEVVWNFGDQTITMSDRLDRRFEFEVQFIARVNNVAGNNDGDTIRNGGVSTITEVRYVNEVGASIVLPIGEAALLVQEPLLALTKEFSVAEVDAADVLRVTVTATNNGTTTAYNPRLLDDLRSTDLIYRGDLQGTNPPTDDLVTLDPNAPIFSWPGGLALAPTESVSFSFSVEVDDIVQPEQILANEVQAVWNSLPSTTTALNSGGSIGLDGSDSGMRFGSLPHAGDAVNDYEATADDTVPVAAVAISKTDLDLALPPEIGAHKTFEIEIRLPEGVTNGVSVEDTLEDGSIGYVLEHDATFDITYTFIGIETINDLPPNEAAFTGPSPIDETTGTATWNIGDVVTLSEDDLTTSLLSPTIRIRYEARIDNVVATQIGETLQNTATVLATHGETGLQTSVSDGTDAITVIESQVTATKALTNVTPGKVATDPPAFNDILQYVVTIINGGNATAYDVNIVDTLPTELALASAFTPTAEIGGLAVAGFTATPTGAPDSPLFWGRQNSDNSLDLPAGQSLLLTYQVVVRAPPADGTTLSNTVYVDWTSLDADPNSLFERTGAGCPTITQPNDYCFGPAVATGTVDPAPPASPLVKAITQPVASIGEAFRYRITIPETPYAFPAFDVRIFDDLMESDADLRFLSAARVSGGAPWTPTNTGTATDLIIGDSTTGIDIPAGEQVVLDIEVVLEDTPTNTTGLSFTNAATYIYNFVDGNSGTQRTGSAGTSLAMTISAPLPLTMDKRGPPTMTLGAPSTFTLDVLNGGNADAWNLTLVDQLPNGVDAGVCETPPANFTAQIFEFDGTTPVSPPLIEGTDYNVTYRGDPDCDITVSMLTSATAVGANERLIVTYESVLDDDSQDGETLTNIAGATTWYSADRTPPATTDDVRSYSRTLSNGTPATDDHEDAFTTTVALPLYRFEMTAANQTTLVNPAVNATPGDLIRYTIQLENLRDAPLDGVVITNVLDALNASPAFEPGSLQIVSVPPGADTSNTDPVGGSDGTGILDIRELSLAALNDTLEIVFEATLASVLPNASFVDSQAEASTNGVTFALSDDPVPVAADPLVAGDEDPARVQIQSAPDFVVEKISTDLIDDPAILLAGEALRYTITVKNVGTDNATDATIRDAVPINTTYVAGSTSLNGVPVPDGPGGTSPLLTGMLLQAPEDPTPGTLRADASPAADNTATVTFDVLIDSDVVDGTVISNQAFVTALLGGVIDQPSDDPGTPLPDDPTRNVVGNAPLLFAPKTAALQVDNGTIGSVDPGDVLRYTISVFNNGAASATLATLTDAIPANTTYVPNTLTMNGLPVGQPDGGVSPLVLGIPISGSTLTPPLPLAGAGQIDPGTNAVITFDLQVNAGVPGGTIISNQARVGSAELPNVLTDGDGNPATGPEPTLVVVGAGQQLAITKQVSVVGGGEATAGGQVEYLVRVTNIGTIPATNVVLTDDLALPVPGQLTYVPGSATLDGSPNGLAVLGSVITADYSTTYGDLPPSGSTTLRFRATLDGSLTIGTNILNTGVVRWNDPPMTADASVSVAIGGTPGVGAVNGAIWHDSDFDLAQAVDEPALSGWFVDLYRNGGFVQSRTTDASGAYRITGIPPNDLNGDTYELRFRAPDAGANTASLGRTDSAFTDGLQIVSDLIVTAGSNLQNIQLPITPSGVVYEAVLRTPLAGATVLLLDAASETPVDASCFEDPAQQGQITGSTGYYKFDLNFSDGSCPNGGDYLLALTPPGSDFESGTSAIIPPQTDLTTPPFAVPGCLGDAVPATALHCEVQASELAPPSTIAARAAGTNYFLHLTLDNSQIPGSSQLFNNHIPLDPVLGGAVALTKTTPSQNVSRGDLVPYEITFNNSLPVPLPDLTLIDRFPAGFRYIEGSARVEGVPIEPIRNGRELVWTDLGVDASSTRTLQLLLAVGAGVTEGEFVNRAQAVSSLTGLAISGEASATVRVVPDPTFDCTDVLGKVFDDANRDGVQNEGERGLPSIRVMTVQGLAVKTDAHGRFHITCAVVPNESRGSNFMLKLDDRTLPSGYRMSTRQTQTKRATRGKALRFQFGASIHRVVGLDLAEAVFEPNTTTIRTQWAPRIEMLLDELEKSESILRLSYLADLEDEGLVAKRLSAVRNEIERAWKERGGSTLEIETEIYWRRGAPAEQPSFIPTPSSENSSEGTLSVLPPETTSLPHVGAGPLLQSRASSESSERHLPGNATTTTWSVDRERLETLRGDRLEKQAVKGEAIETVKRAGLVPPIRFESGEALISPTYVANLRALLDDMRDLQNVRLHLVGHTDDQVLSPRLAEVYQDNLGLSRERAGEVAEFLQRSLSLPPESISFTWAGDSQPLSSNATEEGRRQNRRVEVEVWHDEFREKTSIQEIVIPDEIKRYKVCRTETVCKLRYREGQQKQTRVKNLIPPLRYKDEIGTLSPEFVRQVRMAFENLRDKPNVTAKFIAHTDDSPLDQRSERIYGNALSVSKARARRVALAIQNQLGLPSRAVDSEGHGTSRPVASNATPRGQALNRRIEVEFWYDDPLLTLPDELQVCPAAADSENVTRVYDPPWGTLSPVSIDEGEPIIPDGLAEQLRRGLNDLAGRQNVRLRFVGYTENERLSRRMAEVYGDDIGLSTARARRTMEAIQEALELSSEQVEHEGRGFVHSDDVVNGGFIQGETSFVVAEVVYDERAIVDDYDGVEITPVTRELISRDPLALNLMRITVDGDPIDDPGRSSADIQRCTDVALDKTDIGFRFDGLESERRLSVRSSQDAIANRSTLPLHFRMYNNYPHFLERGEIRIFDRETSVRDEPLAILELDSDGEAAWSPAESDAPGTRRELKFVLRVYDESDLFDETAPQSLWLLPEGEGKDLPQEASAEANLLAGYGESEPRIQNIPIADAGSVLVDGRGIPSDHSVWLAGTQVPVNEDGDFVGEVLLPSGLHTVEVAVLDEEGNGELFLRDLEFEENDWFLMGIADLTLAADITDDPPEALAGNNGVDQNALANGRLAFFADGKFGEDWRITASADTREGPVEDIFSNFLDKSPDSLFRRLDPDYHYPTFGDDSTIEELAPTLGKFFVKLEKGDDHLLWGNFIVRYNDNELALVERGLYGGNVRYQSDSATSFGERRFAIDGFASDPGTVSSREEFRGTGGSVYFLKRRDLLIGSERLRIEIRDKATGIVSEVVRLQPELDYDIDYIQGRLLLSEPLSSIADDRLLVRNDGLSGNEAFLVVQYEFTPGFDEVDTLNTGAQAHAWITDSLKFGLTANRNEAGDDDSNLYAADLTLRKSAQSFLKLQAARSEGTVSEASISEDGGFNFVDPVSPVPDDETAMAYRVDLSVGLSDWIKNTRGQIDLYGQRLGAGYTAPGLNVRREIDQYGGLLRMPITDSVDLIAKGDRSVEERGLELLAAEIDLGYQLSDFIRLEAGARHDKRKDDSVLPVFTQREGERTDAVVQLEYDPNSNWKTYAFGQATVRATGDRDENHRGGIGGSFRLNERVAFDGEVSHGDQGPAAEIGTSLQATERNKLYLNYALDTERGFDGLNERRGNLTFGTRSRISDSASVYAENQYQHANADGLLWSFGIDYKPAERWNLGFNWESGMTRDRRTAAETERRAGGASIGYQFGKVNVSSGVEYIFNETEQASGTKSDRTTWLLRNQINVQLNEDHRLLAKFNWSKSDSSEGEFFDGGFTELIAGYAYRPIRHDRLSTLLKYTYFENLPATDQVGQNNTNSQFLQKSHIAALDLSYDLTQNWSIGGKYAYRLGEVSLERENPDFFENSAHLIILRTDLRLFQHWESLLEGRMLALPDLDERRAGALVALYRYFGDHFKAGIGYNFTDFSEDLTDLSYDHHGVFFNLIGTF